MIFLDYNTTGDGTLSSLIVSKIVKEDGKTLSEQSALMTTYPQVLINVDVRNEVKNKFKAYVGLPNVSDYGYATNLKLCTSKVSSYRKT